MTAVFRKGVDGREASIGRADTTAIAMDDTADAASRIKAARDKMISDLRWDRDRQRPRGH